MTPKAIPLLSLLLLSLASVSKAQDSSPLDRLLSDAAKSQLGNADADIASAIEALAPSVHGFAEVPELKALLSKDRGIPSKDELVGNWKVRSIQVNRLGLFSYPYFNAKFSKVGGMLFFEKTTGSQRRSGFLLPDASGNLVLVGGKTVNEDPQRPHSSLGGTPDSDTIGKVFKIGEGQLIILLDTSPQKFEIYQLKRS